MKLRNREALGSVEGKTSEIPLENIINKVTVDRKLLKSINILDTVIKELYGYTELTELRNKAMSTRYKAVQNVADKYIGDNTGYVAKKVLSERKLLKSNMSLEEMTDAFNEQFDSKQQRNTYVYNRFMCKNKPLEVGLTKQTKVYFSREAILKQIKELKYDKSKCNGKGFMLIKQNFATSKREFMLEQAKLNSTVFTLDEFELKLIIRKQQAKKKSIDGLIIDRMKVYVNYDDLSGKDEFDTYGIVLEKREKGIYEAGIKLIHMEGDYND